MKKLIKLLFGLFRRKPASQEEFDVDWSGGGIVDGDRDGGGRGIVFSVVGFEVDPKMSKKMKEIFATDHRFAELLVYDEDSRKKVERLLETIEEDPDRL
jgi:hypothetical protein